MGRKIIGYFERDGERNGQAIYSAICSLGGRAEVVIIPDNRGSYQPKREGFYSFLSPNTKKQKPLTNTLFGELYTAIIIKKIKLLENFSDIVAIESNAFASNQFLKRFNIVFFNKGMTFVHLKDDKYKSKLNEIMKSIPKRYRVEIIDSCILKIIHPGKNISNILEQVLIDL